MKILMTDYNDEPLDYLIGYTEGMEIDEIERDREFWQDRTWHFSQRTRFRWTEYAHWFQSQQVSQSQRLLHATKQFNEQIRQTPLFEAAKLTIRKLIERGLIDVGDIPDDKKKKAEEALAYTAAVVRDMEVPHETRLKAAKILLDFTAERPTTKSDVTVKRAEDFLALIAETDDDADSDTDQDAYTSSH